MKRLAVFICLLALVSGSIVTPAFAIVDIGDPRVTRLWSMTDEGTRFTCSATWIRPAREGVSWLLSAGHCAISNIVRREVTGTFMSRINWRVVITSHRYAGRELDIAIGTAPDTRNVPQFHSFFASEFPKEGTLLYIHGVPEGVESVVVAHVVGPSKDAPGTMEVSVEPGSIRGGSSGSVVLDSAGFIVGVLWGIERGPSGEYTPTALVTPIEAFNDIIKLIDAKVAGDGE